MRDLNKTLLIGTLVKDPELRTTTSGTSVCDFTLVVVDKRKNAKTGEIESRPFYMDIVAWRRLGENIADFSRKGDRIYIEGMLCKESWVSKTTQEKKTKISLTAREVIFLERPDKSRYEDIEFDADEEGTDYLDEQPRT